MINFTAQGSPAQLNTLSFAKVGKIKENFISLEIGDIRKGENGYYIWVREKIELIENDVSEIRIYDWIYQVVEIENEMKIVNYFSYK